MTAETPLVSKSIYPYLCSLFSAIVIAGNVYALKIVNLGLLSSPAGMICFPFSFSIVDIVTEVYGEKTAKRFIRTGLINLIFFIALLQIVLALPSDLSVSPQEEFNGVFSLSWRIFLGTIAGYYLGESINSKCLSILKFITDGTGFFQRSFYSTIIGITVDTVIFNLIAFVGVIPVEKLTPFIFKQYILKIFFAWVGAYVVSKIIPSIKRKEKSDVLDKYTYKWVEKVKENYSVYFNSSKNDASSDADELK